MIITLKTKKINFLSKMIKNKLLTKKIKIYMIKVLIISTIKKIIKENVVKVLNFYLSNLQNVYQLKFGTL
jgi:hypothetical protein